jgi:hypothetical protein
MTWTAINGSYHPSINPQPSGTNKGPFTANPVLQQFQEYRQEVLMPASAASSNYGQPPSALTDYSSMPSATFTTPGTTGSQMELATFDDVMNMLSSTGK